MVNQKPSKTSRGKLLNWYLKALWSCRITSLCFVVIFVAIPEYVFHMTMLVVSALPPSHLHGSDVEWRSKQKQRVTRPICAVSANIYSDLQYIVITQLLLSMKLILSWNGILTFHLITDVLRLLANNIVICHGSIPALHDIPAWYTPQQMLHCQWNLEV